MITYQTLLTNKDLSKENKNRLVDDIKKLQASKSADEIVSLSKKLDADGKNSQVQVEKSRVARELATAKQGAQGDITKAETLLASSYISNTDKINLQKDVDNISKATDVAGVKAAQVTLKQDNLQVEKNNEVAQKKAEEKAATQVAQNSVSDSEDSSSTTGDGWTTAPTGKVYVSGSNKYYTSVKNPSNYTLKSISDAENEGATAGHSNGFARN